MNTATLSLSVIWLNEAGEAEAQSGFGPGGGMRGSPNEGMRGKNGMGNMDGETSGWMAFLPFVWVVW